MNSPISVSDDSDGDDDHIPLSTRIAMRMCLEAKAQVYQTLELSNIAMDSKDIHESTSNDSASTATSRTEVARQSDLESLGEDVECETIQQELPNVCETKAGSSQLALSNELDLAHGGSITLAALSQPVAKSRRRRTPEEILAEKEKREDAKRAKLALKEQKKTEVAMAKDREKQEKLQARMLAVQRKHITQETSKKSALNFVTVRIDPALFDFAHATAKKREEDAAKFAAQLSNYGVQMELGDHISSNAPALHVQWYRESTSDNGTKAVKQEREVVHVVSLADFLNMVHADRNMAAGAHIALTAHIRLVQGSLNPDARLTVFVFGLLQAYFQNLQTVKNQAHRNAFLAQNNSPEKCNVGKKIPKTLRDANVVLSPDDVQQVLLDVQTLSDVVVHFVKDIDDLATHIVHMSKAIANIPYKRQKEMLTSDCASYFSKEACVQVAKDGKGQLEAWVKMLQQVPGVGREAARAIMDKYGSPWLLVQAYKRCASSSAAELLLQDIVVGRGADVLATSRRLGPQISKKIHALTMNRNAFTNVQIDSQ